MSNENEVTDLQDAPVSLILEIPTYNPFNHIYTG